MAAYVGFAAARAGEDEGALAQAGLAGATTGEQIFTAAGCAGCHKLTKAGANGTIGPSLDDLASSRRHRGQPRGLRQGVDPRSRRRGGDGFQAGVMPSFDGKLTDKQVQALVQYLLGD